MTGKPDLPNDSQITMKVMQSGRQTARRLIIFRRIHRQPFYFGRTCYTRTPGHLLFWAF